jgi:hypothetical protein
MFQPMIQFGSIHRAPTELRNIYFERSYKHFVPTGR